MGCDNSFGYIYAPNQDQMVFLHFISTSLAPLMSDDLLLGGDFNCVADVLLDRFIPLLLGAPACKITEGLREWLGPLDRTDVWRTQHRDTRDYSFYSPIYRLHMRIDNCVCSHRLSHSMLHTEYLRQTLSDHSPLLLDFQQPESTHEFLYSDSTLWP